MGQYTALQLTSAPSPMLRGGGPAYVIFHDAALREMAELRPVSPEKLLEVGGVGRMKLEKYGEEFFAVLKRWDAPAVE